MLYKAKWASATYLAQQMRGARGGSPAHAGEQPAHAGANGPGGKQLRAAQRGAQANWPGAGDTRPAQTAKTAAQRAVVARNICKTIPELLLNHAAVQPVLFRWLTYSQ